MDLGYYGSDRNQRLLRERVQDRWMDAYAPTRHLDPLLIVAAAALSVIGVLMVYSATFHRLELQGQPAGQFATRQLINLVVALVGMLIAALPDYRLARSYAPVIYVGGLLLLVVVLSPLGTEINGSKSWLVLGGVQLQPAELVKVALVVAVAALLHESKGEPSIVTVLAAVALVGAASGLVLLQPDLGTFLVFPWIGFVLLLVSGTRARHLIALSVLAVIGVVLVFQLGLLKEYQVARLTAFLDPDNPSLAESSLYNTHQSMIAVGSGGVIGKGLFQGTQTNLAYVPENHTDFIFTVVGEEFGFFGAGVVVGLYGLLLWRGLRIAAMAKDLFGTLLAAGAVGVFSIQLFVNVGMTIGISPVTGIPLPFVSYGGTSILAGWVLVGLMLNVHMRRF